MRTERQAAPSYQTKVEADTSQTKRLIWFCLALAFLLTGLALGQAQPLFRKAVAICLECIGIG